MKRSVPLTQGAPYYFYSSLDLDVRFPHHLSVRFPLLFVVTPPLAYLTLGVPSSTRQCPRRVVSLAPPLSNSTETNWVIILNTFSYNSPLPPTRVVLSFLSSSPPLPPSLPLALEKLFLTSSSTHFVPGVISHFLLEVRNTPPSPPSPSSTSFPAPPSPLSHLSLQSSLTFQTSFLLNITTPILQVFTTL